MDDTKARATRAAMGDLWYAVSAHDVDEDGYAVGVLFEGVRYVGKEYAVNPAAIAACQALAKAPAVIDHWAAKCDSLAAEIVKLRDELDAERGKRIASEMRQPTHGYESLLAERDHYRQQCTEGQDEIAALREQVARLRRVLELCRSMLDQLSPPTPEHTCGTPNAACGGECVDWADHQNVLSNIDAALADTAPGEAKQTGGKP